MIIEKFVSGFLDTNTYVMKEDRHLLIIDPADYATMLEKCRNATSVTVLLTHVSGPLAEETMRDEVLRGN